MIKSKVIKLSVSKKNINKKKSPCNKPVKVKKEKNIDSKPKVKKSNKETPKPKVQLDLSTLSREELITNHINMVKKYASKYAHQSSISVNDLVQEGCLGLMKAADKFDISKGYRFTTYATPWVLKYIKDALYQNRIVSETSEHCMRITQLDTITERFKSEHGYNPTIEDLSKLSGYTEDQVSEVLRHRVSMVYLDRPLNDESDSGTIGDHIGEEDTTEEFIDKFNLHSEMDKESLGECFKKSMMKLKPKQRKAVIMYYGENKSITSIARCLNMRGDTFGVRKLIRSGMDKLKQSLSKYSK